MNSGAGAGTALQRCASASGACSWRSSSASCRCVCCTLARTPSSPIRIRTGKRVDEQPQHPIRPRSALHAPEQHRPEHHVAPARDPRQHLRPGQVAQARRAHAQRARPRRSRLASAASTASRAFHDPAAVALHVEQPERRGRLVDVAQQLAEERLVLLHG